MRSWQIWSVFGVCLVVALAAMAWVSWTVLRLDRAVRHQTLTEENVRLALWRMDSSLAPFIAQETARPYFTYNAFYSAERAYTKMFAEIEKGEVLVPSPLLIQSSPRILVHFQIGPDGRFSSPQVPTGNMRDLAESAYTTHEKIDEAGRRLAEVAGLLGGQELLGEQAPKTSRIVARPAGPWRNAPQRQGQLLSQEESQRRRSVQEFEARSQSYWQTEDLGKLANLITTVPDVAPGEGLEPLWVDDALLLVRKVVVDGRDYIQGCWLNWEHLGKELLASIADLLPEARLEAPAAATEDGERRLAALPVRLVPGPVREEPAPISSPVRFTIFSAWGCGLLAVLAVAALLRGVMSLSERRRVFVSAVTHELRTPLTTFRIYTDMLADGMVEGEEKKRDYLVRLRGEAERLGHLVENVLFYARLESGRAGVASERINLREFVERVTERLRERAERAGMQLLVKADEADSPIHVRVDCSALEQILVNLIDNACKYADSASERTIRIHIERRGPRTDLRVRDRGPGITLRDRQRLFRPFSKSDREAANTAPGVGLGLALSRLLARAIGGELQLDEEVKDGACFVLSLPLAS